MDGLIHSILFFCYLSIDLKREKGCDGGKPEISPREKELRQKPLHFFFN